PLDLDRLAFAIRMKDPRLTKLICDRNRAGRIDDQEANSRIPRFGRNQLEAPGLLVAFRELERGTRRPNATSTASSSSASATARRTALSASVGCGKPVDVESDFAWELAR